MADEPGKDDADRGVMGNLPATRPNRLSRRGRTDGSTDAPPATPSGAPSRGGSRPAGPRKPRPKAATTAPQAGAAPRKSRSGTTTAAPSAGAGPRAPRPKAVRAGSPELREPARKAVAGREAAGDAASQAAGPGELATTVVKAAGELAQIGATVAGQLVKRAVGRFPKP